MGRLDEAWGCALCDRTRVQIIVSRHCAVLTAEVCQRAWLCEPRGVRAWSV